MKINLHSLLEDTTATLLFSFGVNHLAFPRVKWIKKKPQSGERFSTPTTGYMCEKCWPFTGPCNEIVATDSLRQGKTYSDRLQTATTTSRKTINE